MKLTVMAVMSGESRDRYQNEGSIEVYFEQKRTNGPSVRKQRGTNVIYWRM